jgi:hypothetical protein
MFRRTAAALAVTSLAFAGIAADGESGASASIENLSVTSAGGVITVTGTPVFSGGEVTAITDGGGATPGFGIAGATMQQVDADLIFTMDVVGNVAPGTLYTIPLGVTGLGDNRLFAFANTTTDPDFQIANLDDGYSSTGISGTMSGTTITWNVPLATLGASAGAKIGSGAAPLTNSLGVSPQGAASLQLSGLAGVETADWTAASYIVGGGMSVEVVGGDVEEFAKAKVRRGEAAVSFDELPAGTYTVTVTTGFADATFEEIFTVTI